MNNTLLDQCIASGQASAEQIEAHRSAGEVAGAVQPPTAQAVQTAVTNEEVWEAVGIFERNESNSDGFRELLTNFLNTRSIAQAKQPQQSAAMQEKCLACNGHGLIGGMTPEGGECYPCPDCNTPSAAINPTGGPV